MSVSRRDVLGSAGGVVLAGAAPAVAAAQANDGASTGPSAAIE